MHVGRDAAGLNFEFTHGHSALILRSLVPTQPPEGANTEAIPHERVWYMAFIPWVVMS